MNNEEIRTLDLFSGIGGFSLGLERAGPFRTVAFCEQDQFAQRVLKKHWPEVPIYDDVRTIPTDGLGRIDLICGGFPCQPWSVAGNQKGAEDDRDLWPAMVALVEKLQPKFLIGENVQGFVNEPMDLARALSDLESIGYQSTYWILPAASVGASHKRNRVFILAHTGHGRRRNVGFAEVGEDPQGERSTNTSSFSRSSQQPSFVANCNGGSCRSNPRTLERTEGAIQKGGEQFQPRPQARNGGEDVANANDERSQRTKQSKTYQGETETRLLTTQSITTEGNHWEFEPNVGRVAHGVPNRVDRLKCLGNAVVPQVVEQIGRAIIEGWQR